MVVFSVTCSQRSGRKCTQFFEGATLVIPMVHPHMDTSIYPVLGRVLSHGYLVAGHLPVRSALPTLINMLLGPKPVSSTILLEAFLDYISTTERTIFKEALTYGAERKFSSAIQETLECIVQIWMSTAPNATQVSKRSHNMSLCLGLLQQFFQFILVFQSIIRDFG